jgi:hypothetical protein
MIRYDQVTTSSMIQICIVSELGKQGINDPCPSQRVHMPKSNKLRDTATESYECRKALQFPLLGPVVSR